MSIYLSLFLSHRSSTSSKVRCLPSRSCENTRGPCWAAPSALPTPPWMLLRRIVANKAMTESYCAGINEFLMFTVYSFCSSSTVARAAGFARIAWRCLSINTAVSGERCVMPQINVTGRPHLRTVDGEVGTRLRSAIDATREIRCTR